MNLGDPDGERELKADLDKAVLDKAVLGLSLLVGVLICHWLGWIP